MRLFNFLKKNKIKFLSLFIIIKIVFLIVFLKFFLPIFDLAWGKDKDNVTLGVVELSKIISAHKLSDKLYQLDNKIAGLENELYAEGGYVGVGGIGTESPERLSKSDYMKVQSIHQKAKEELEKEIAVVKAQIKQQEFLLKEKMSALGKETTKALGEVKDEEKDFELPQKLSAEIFKENSNKFLKELNDLKNRQILAKKMELQKELEDILKEALRAQSEALSSYETELLKANQNKKINLQFKYNLAPDKETREKLKKELDEIEKEEKELKQQKIALLQGEYENIKRDQTKRIEKELLNYQKKLEADILKQLKSHGLSLESLMYSSSKKGKIIGKYEADRKKLEQELIQTRTASFKRLEAKRKELEDRLKEEEKKLIEQSQKQQKYFSQYREKQLNSLKKELEKLKGERKDLYNSILLDVNQKISKVAKQEKVSVVLSWYIVNINCEDLTDLVLLEMRKEKDEVKF